MATLTPHQESKIADKKKLIGLTLVLALLIVMPMLFHWTGRMTVQWLGRYSVAEKPFHYIYVYAPLALILVGFLWRRHAVPIIVVVLFVRELIYAAFKGWSHHMALAPGIIDTTEFLGALFAYALHELSFYAFVLFLLFSQSTRDVFRPDFRDLGCPHIADGLVRFTGFWRPAIKSVLVGFLLIMATAMAAYWFIEVEGYEANNWLAISVVYFFGVVLCRACVDCSANPPETLDHSTRRSLHRIRYVHVL